MSRNSGTVLLVAEPSWFRRHVHLMVMLLVAVAAGLIAKSPYLVGMGVMVQLIDSHLHARKEHPNDWRANRGLLFVPIFFLVWWSVLLIWYATIITPYSHYDPVTGTMFCCAGQWIMSDTWHRRTHGYAFDDYDRFNSFFFPLITIVGAMMVHGPYLSRQ